MQPELIEIDSEAGNIDDTGLYQSALVLLPDKSFAARVLELREIKKIPAPPEFQLQPHLTVLFLGSHKGNKLKKIYASLRPELYFTSPLVAEEIAFFSDGKNISNIHFKVRQEDALFRKHLQAVQAYKKTSLPLQTRFHSAKFKPHVSIFDQVCLPEKAFRRSEWACPPIVFNIERAVYFLKPLSSFSG